MSCNIINKKNPEQLSELSQFLMDAQNFKNTPEALDIVSKQYGYFTSNNFMRKFGDWTKSEFLDSKKNIKRVNPKTGEPLLFKEGDNYYAIALNGRRIYAPINKFDKLYQLGITEPLEFKKEVGNVITKYIFDKYGVDALNLDFSNLKDINIKSNITEFFEATKQAELDRISGKKNHTQKELDATRTTYDNYISMAGDFVSDVQDFLLSVNLTLTDSNDTRSQEELENNSLGLDLKSSVTVNNKDNVGNRIKLLTSFLPAYYKNGKKMYSKYFYAQKFVPFDKVWTDLLPVLSSVSKHLNQNGQVEDPMNVIVARLKDISTQKFHLRKLVQLLNEADETTKTQFANTFSDLTEYKHVTTEIGGFEGSRFIKAFNAAEAAKKSNKILSEWSQYFKDAYIAETKTGFAINEDAIKELISSADKFITQYITIKKRVNIEVDPRNKQKIQFFLINRLEQYGIKLSVPSLEWFMSEGGKKAITNDVFYDAADDIVQSLDYLTENLNESKDELVNKDTYFEIYTEVGKLKETTITKLAEAEGTFNYDVSEDTIMAGDVTKWKYSLLNHINGNIQIWKQNPQELANLLDVPFHKNSKWIAKLLENNGEGLKKLSIALTNTFQEEGKAAEGTNNVNTKKIDDVVTDVYKVLGHKVSNNLPSYATPVPADKATGIRIELDYFIDTKTRVNETTNAIILSNEVYDIFTDYFEDEYISSVEAKNEILEATDEQGNVDTSNLLMFYHTNGRGFVYELVDNLNDGKVTGYNNLQEIYKLTNEDPTRYIIRMGGNAFKSYTFSSIPTDERIKPGMLYSGEIEGMPILEHTQQGLSKQQRSVVRNIIPGILDKFIKKQGRKFQEYRLIDNKYQPLNLDKNLAAQYENNTLYMLADYTINSTIAQIEFQKLFSGAVNKHKNIVDYFKRIPGTYIDGKGLRLGLTENDHLFNVSVISDNYVSSEYVDQIDFGTEEENEAIRKYYRDINQADAQAYITPQRWRFLMERLGKWSDKHEAVYNKIMDPKQPALDKSEIKLLSSKPVKGVYRSLIQGRPVYLKYSQAVLIPSAIKGTGLETILNKMTRDPNNIIDEVVFESGIKIGAYSQNANPEDIINDDSVNFNSITLDNRFWKLQQDLPTKGVKATKLGTQIQKNILLGLNFNADYNGQSGLSLYQELHGLMSELSNLGIADIVNQFGIGKDNYEIKDWSRFKDSIVEQLKQQDMPSNIVEAVQRELSPFVVPQARDKIISTIFSIIKKAAIDIETNGASMIQMSNYGLDYNSAKEQGVYFLYDLEDYNGGTRLAEPRIVNVDGRKVVKPGQVFISSGWLSKYIPNWRDYKIDDLFGKINPETGKREGGMVDPRALNLVGYRIPNQGVSSNDALEVVGILPDSYEDTIVTYTGITTKTGSDFDIDKMYMMLPHLQPQFSNPNTLISKLRDTGLNEETAEKLLTKFNYYSNDYSKYDKNRNPMIDLFNFIITSNDKTKFGIEVVNLMESIDEQVSDYGEVIGLNYVEYDKTKDFNSKKALENRILELYTDVLTNEGHYKALISPLDFEFFEDNIKELNDLNKGEVFEDLDMFSSIKQIETKHDYYAGKYGIGQIANHLVDHSRGQKSDIFLRSDLGWGNTSKGNTLIDKNAKGEYVSESLNEAGIPKNLRSIPIVNSISAILNAYVDIAKDPYITKGNWNTLTANMGMLLIRAGVHPFKVNAFLAQPVLKVLVNTKNVGEAKVTPYQDGKEAEEELRKQSENLLKSALLKEGYKPFDIKKIIDAAKSKNTMTVTIGDKTISNQFSKRKYNEVKNHVKPDVTKDALYYFDQYIAFKEYDKMVDLTKEMNTFVQTGKTGETGAGSNPIMTMITKNKLADLYYNDTIGGLNTRYSGNGLNETFLATFYNNTVGFMSNLIEDNPSMFITYTEKYRDLYNEIAANTSKFRDYMNDEKLGYAIENGIYADLISKFNPFVINSKEEYNDMFYRLHNTIRNIKRDINHPLYNNFFIEQLELKPDKNFRFIGVNNLRIKPKFYEDAMTESWRKIFDQDAELGNLLVKYAYYQSGFKNNANQIFKYIPHEFFIENDLDNYLNVVSSQDINNTEIVRKIYKHNFDNNSLVPQIGGRNDFNVYKGKMENKPNWFILNDLSERHIGFNSEYMIKIYPPFVTRNNPVEGIDLFELQGYVPRNYNGRIKRVPLYTKTNKLGYKSKRGQIIEYGGISDESIYSDNNLSEDEQSNINTIIEKAQELNMLPATITVDRKGLSNITKVGVQGYTGNRAVSDSNPIVKEVLEHKPNDGYYKAIIQQDGTEYTVELNEYMQPQTVTFVSEELGGIIKIDPNELLLTINDKQSLADQIIDGKVIEEENPINKEC